jgi:hypothetical protein
MPKDQQAPAPSEPPNPLRHLLPPHSSLDATEAHYLQTYIPLLFPEKQTSIPFSSIRLIRCKTTIREPDLDSLSSSNSKSGNGTATKYDLIREAWYAALVASDFPSLSPSSSSSSSPSSAPEAAANEEKNREEPKPTGTGTESTKTQAEQQQQQQQSPRGFQVLMTGPTYVGDVIERIALPPSRRPSFSLPEPDQQQHLDDPSTWSRSSLSKSIFGIGKSLSSASPAPSSSSSTAFAVTPTANPKSSFSSFNLSKNQPRTVRRYSGDAKRAVFGGLLEAMEEELHGLVLQAGAEGGTVKDLKGERHWHGRNEKMGGVYVGVGSSIMKN